jgi:hypothetical protein
VSGWVGVGKAGVVADAVRFLLIAPIFAFAGGGGEFPGNGPTRLADRSTGGKQEKNQEQARPGQNSLEGNHEASIRDLTGKR